MDKTPIDGDGDGDESGEGDGARDGALIGELAIEGACAGVDLLLPLISKMGLPNCSKLLPTSLFARLVNLQGIGYNQ